MNIFLMFGLLALVAGVVSLVATARPLNKYGREPLDWAMILLVLGLGLLCFALGVQALDNSLS